jgi:hypothetical protein
LQENWKETDINVDSLRLYGEREIKLANIYHGSFIPQILRQLKIFSRCVKPQMM